MEKPTLPTKLGSKPVGFPRLVSPPPEVPGLCPRLHQVQRRVAREHRTGVPASGSHWVFSNPVFVQQRVGVGWMVIFCIRFFVFAEVWAKPSLFGFLVLGFLFTGFILLSEVVWCKFRFPLQSLSFQKQSNKTWASPCLGRFWFFLGVLPLPQRSSKTEWLAIEGPLSVTSTSNFLLEGLQKSRLEQTYTPNPRLKALIVSKAEGLNQNTRKK